MPLTPSDSVDAFLSWLATPTLPLPSSQSGRGNRSQHKLGASQGQDHTPSADAVPPTSPNTGLKLRELSKSPLEDMALPLLLNVSPTSARSSTPRDGPGGNANYGPDSNAGVAGASQPSTTEVGSN